MFFGMAAAAILVSKDREDLPQQLREKPISCTILHSEGEKAHVRFFCHIDYSSWVQQS